MQNIIQPGNMVQAVAVLPVGKAGRPYNMDVKFYTAAGSIILSETCFAFMFTNVGDDTAFVNQIRVFPSATPLTALGDSRTISGHDGDIYKGMANITFAGVGVNPKVEVIQLFYV